MENTINIPTLDLSVNDNSILSKQFYNACTETGFFFLKNHGISKAQIEELFAESKRFFTQPVEFKETVTAKQSSINRGWQPHRGETINTQNQRYGDTKESYAIGRQVEEGHPLAGKVLQGVNRWPQGAEWENWKRVMEQHRDACELLGQRLSKVLSLALGKQEDYIAQLYEYPFIILHLLHYEKTISRPEDGLFACGAHSDYSLFTFLLIDNEPGLEILLNGQWYEVPAVETDVFIVNIGDMTMHLSNGKFKSTVHRVINKTGRERYSIPLFYEPDVRGIVEPICAEGEVPKYQPVTYGDVIYQKYVETYSWFTESQQIK